MEQEQPGPQNTLQFITMMIKSLITGIPQMLKSIIITTILSFVGTLAIHFYLILFPNDGYNSAGNPILNSILVLGDIQPTANVYLFWFLGNYLFWYVIGTFKQYGIAGGVKQFLTTPLFVGRSLKQSGFGAFPMLMGGLGFAFILRLGILGTMTTLQMFLMTIGILVSQEDSITLIGLRLFFNDVKNMVNKGSDEPPEFGLPATMVLGSVIGFAYLVFMPYNVFMVKVVAGLMVLGLIAMFLQGRKRGKAEKLAMVLMILCVFAVAASPVQADDGGAKENNGAMNVINNAGLRNFMIKQGINPALAGIAAALYAQGKLTPKIFDQLRRGKLKPTSDMDIREMETMWKVRDKLLDNLQHIENEIWFGKAQKLWKEDGAPGDMRKHIDGLIEDIIHGKEVDLNKYGKIHNLYMGHITGRYITEDQIPTDAELNSEIFNNTVSWTAREFVTGQDIDGNISWLAVGTRIAVGIGTGGSSEYVWATTEGLVRFHDFYMAGDDYWTAMGKTAAWITFEEMVIGKGIEYGLGKVTPWIGKGFSKAGSYVDETFPAFSGKVKNLVGEAGDYLNRDVTDLWPKKPKPGLPRGSQYKSAAEIAEDMTRMKNSGQKLPGLDDVKVGQKGPGGDVEVDFTKMKPVEGDLPMVPRDVRGVEEVAEMSDAIVVVRKGNEAGLDVIQSKAAHPKSMDIKAKSINEYDRMLGFDDVPAINGRGTNEGLVGCKKPRLPDNFDQLDPTTKSKVMNRFNQRMNEFENLGPELQQMRREGKIDWDPETGIVRNAKDGKPYAGDNDPMIYLDPDTGQPLNPIRTNTVNRGLQQNGTTVHNEHGGWNYNDYQTSNPGKFNQYENIDQAILNGHQNGNLLAYNPRTKQWYEVAWDGSTQRNWGPWRAAGGQ